MRSLLLVPPLLLAACAGGSDPAPASSSDQTLMQTAEAMTSPLPPFPERAADAVVIDVRTPGEWADGTVVGAEKIDVTAPDFLAEVQALGLAPNTPLYLYCRTGNRSGRAEAELRQAGYTRILNVGGYSSLVSGGAATE